MSMMVFLNMFGLRIFVLIDYMSGL